jgi:trimethylamine--corrinoid protein Co-methyltransferase
MADELTVWPDEAIEVMERTTRDLLARVGVKVLSTQARELMIGAGCTALDGERLAIPWEVVKEAGDSLPAVFTLAARDDSHSLPVSFAPGDTWTHTVGGAAFICDAQTGVNRRAGLSDVVAMARLQHHLAYPDLVSAFFVPYEIVGEIEPLFSYFAAAFETDRCVLGPGLWSAEQVRGLWELAELCHPSDLSRDRYGLEAFFSPLSPLTIAADVSEAIMEAARLGAVCAILPCPVAGTTAPAPLAAAVAQQAAEVIAGLVLTQAVRPGTPTVCGARLMGCDPRTGSPTTGGPEMGTAAQAATLLARRLRMPSDVYGFATESRVADVQCGFERAVGGLLGAMARPAFISGMGNMQSGIASAFELLPIDAEICRWVLFALGERAFDEHAMDVDGIERGALSSQGFLSLKETRRYLRTETVRSSVSFRDGQERYLAGGAGMLATARQQVGDALANPPVGLPDDVVAEAETVIANAARRIGIHDFPTAREVVRTCRSVVGIAQ